VHIVLDQKLSEGDLGKNQNFLTLFLINT